MPNLKISLLPLVCAAMLAAGPIAAQDSSGAADDTATQTEAPADGGIGLNLGEPVSEQENIGRTYTTDTFGDWEIRCIKTADGNDPCQMYQLLHDENGNSVAEISLFALPDGQEAVAGAMIIAPLETLLTKQLTIGVDGGEARRYPFTWCSGAGCYSRVGLTAADLAVYKRGSAATMTIVPVAAPDKKVDLKVSLTGFTLAFEAVKATN